jgi:hypothetical protein
MTEFIFVNNMANLKIPVGYTTQFDNTGDCLACVFCDEDLNCLHPAGAASCGCQDYDVVFVKE